MTGSRSGGRPPGGPGGPGGDPPAPGGPGEDRWDRLTAEQADALSVRELEAGRLPVRAQQRLATMQADRAFTSDLTVDEHHAIRSVGFEPVGQVLGSCVYHLGVTTGPYCGWQGWKGWSTPAVLRELPSRGQALVEARERAMRRMRAECAGLGGDGVVAVRLAIQPFPAGGVEFHAIGTAVRAAGPVRPPTPFLSDLTGQDFAKLIVAGWVPAGLVLGLAVLIRHDDSRTRWQAGRLAKPQEIAGYTDLVHRSRAMARDRLRQDCAGHGGAGVVVRTMTLQVSERTCGAGPGDDNQDHVAEAMVIGTAITPFRHAGGNAPHAPLPIMRLSPRPKPYGRDRQWIRDR